MEQTIKNFIMPATKIHDSLTLGRPEEEIITGTAKRVTKTARRGLIEKTVSIYKATFCMLIQEKE